MRKHLLEFSRSILKLKFLLELDFKRHLRKRSSQQIRNILAETELAARHFIWPIFIYSEDEVKPSNHYGNMTFCTVKNLEATLERAVNHKILAVMLFPIVPKELKTNEGEYALREDSLLFLALKQISHNKLAISIWVDIALDPYTSHGHDAVLYETKNSYVVDNDKTVEILSDLSLHLIQAGANAVCPSGMMDGQVKNIRAILSKNNYEDNLIISYGAKFSSCFYGPFRTALGIKNLEKIENKKTYQVDYRNIKEPISEILTDIDEGADMIIVKPGLPYLDIILQASNISPVPILAYQVSGELAMIHYGSQMGLFNFHDAVYESCIALKRAGAQAIISYAAPEIIQYINEEKP